jgi:hypothetical protein
MARKITSLVTALMLALSGAAFTACSEDDRPEGEDIERTVDGAAEDAGNAAEDAGNAVDDAAENATDGE